MKLSVKDNIFLFNRLTFYTLCIVLGFSITSVAQEPEVQIHVKELRGADHDGVIMIESKTIRGKSIEITDVEGDVIIATEGLEVDIDTDEIDIEDRGEDRDEEAQRSRRWEKEEKPQGDFPPEVKDIMKEKNLSPEDLRDPEKRKQLREEVERRRKEAQKDNKTDESSSDDSGKEKKDRQPKEGIARYMDVVAKKNLFMPLGSGGEKKRTEFAVTAVMFNNSQPSNSKAIIEQQGGGKSYYVSEGDTFADKIEVVDIEDQVVKVNRSGKEEELKLGSGIGGGRRGGGGRGRRPNKNAGGKDPRSNNKGSEGAARRDRDSGNRNFDPSMIPEPIKRIMKERGITFEQLRDNPDLQAEFRREMQQRFRGGGEGNARRMRSAERRSRR